MLAHASSYVQYWYFKVHLGNCALGGIPSLSWINKPVSVTLPLGKNAFQDRDNEPRVSWPAVGWVVVVTAAGCGGAGWMEVKTDVLEPLPYGLGCSFSLVILINALTELFDWSSSKLHVFIMNSFDVIPVPLFCSAAPKSCCAAKKGGHCFIYRQICFCFFLFFVTMTLTQIRILAADSARIVYMWLVERQNNGVPLVRNEECGTNHTILVVRN